MNPMSNQAEESGRARPSVVDTVFDAALAWVDAGLARLKTSLDASARALDRAAIALEDVRDKLRA